MLGLWFSFWAIHIIQTDALRQLRILPEVEKDEQINEEGSTLTLTCIQEEKMFFSTDLRWILPQSEVIKIDLDTVYSVVTSTRVFSSGKMIG
jgi:hypothetical protein